LHFKILFIHSDIFVTTTT